MAEPLIVNTWQSAIAGSPHLGFGLMRCVDLDSFPGAVKVQKAPASLFHTSLSTTFTADASTNVLTTVANISDLITGTAVTVSSSVTLPAGLSAGTNYFVIAVSNTTCKLATTIANANAATAIDITDAGSGTHTIATVNPGTVNHIVRDSRSDVHFFQDSNALVWYLSSGSTRCLLLNGNFTTQGAGNGLVTFRVSGDTAVYLIAFRNRKIDIVNVFATANLEAPSWSNDWQTMTTGAGTANRHHAIVAQDNVIYFTDANLIGSIKEVTTFDPSSSPTYSYNNSALDVPTGEVLAHLDELGIYLLAGSNVSDRIYPWDRLSGSFNLPYIFPEKQIHRFKNLGNIVYVLAGTYGNIYATNGSSIWFFNKLPDQVTNNSGTLQANIVTWGGIDAVQGSLLFGASVLTSGNSGVYRLYPDGRLLIDQIPSSGSSSATAIFAYNNFYFFGYASGADRHTTSRYANFEGVVQSPFYKVATKTEKAKYSVLEAVLAKPAASGNVRVGYRFDTSSAFTTLNSFAADGVNITFQDPGIGLIDVENIQLQAEIDGAVELMEIRLLE